MAITALVVAASKVNKFFGSFSGWLMAGLGAAFSLLLAKFEAVSRVLCVSHVRIALLLRVVGLIASILARLLSTMVSFALGSHKASAMRVKTIRSSGRPSAAAVLKPKGAMYPSTIALVFALSPLPAAAHGAALLFAISQFGVYVAIVALALILCAKFLTRKETDFVAS